MTPAELLALGGTPGPGPLLGMVSAGLLGVMAAIALVNSLLALRLHWFPASTTGPRVSVLVPARDEAANLRRLLPALRGTRYPHVEIIVLDDDSRDDTAAVARRHAREDERVRRVPGRPVPPGWTGKNWACHQLARHAAGDVLLFCDADVVPGPDAIGRTRAALSGLDAHVATVLPAHERTGWFQAAVIPLITSVPVAALLPLPLVRCTRAASLSMGNGQWMAWSRRGYDAVGGHAAVRSDVLEDVRLARRAKRHGLRLAVLPAPRDVTVRMYGSAADAREGFGKNLYPLVGGRDATALPGLFFFLAVFALPLALPFFVPGPWGWLPLAGLAAIRVLSARLVGEGAGGVLLSVLLHPVGVLAATVILLSSRSLHRTGRVRWKRRVIGAETA